MATIGGYERNEDGYLDESMEWLFGEGLTKIIKPGYFTVGQCALLIPAFRKADTNIDSAALDETIATYVMLIMHDVAKGDVTVRHPHTLLPYGEYQRMAQTGMYGDDCDDMPMPDMGWLIEIDEAQRWYEKKGFDVDLSKVKADMEAMLPSDQLGDLEQADVGGKGCTPTVEPWVKLAREYADDIYLRRLENNDRTEKKAISVEIAARLERAGKVTKTGKRITSGNVERWALRQWNPPEIKE